MDSLWIDSVQGLSNFESLNNNLETDICIIGASIFGMTCGYYLSHLGFNVVLIDKNNLAGTTCFTTKKITSQHGLFYTYLINTFGKDFAKNYLYANENGLQLAKNIITSEDIQCDYEEQDNFVYTVSNDEINKVEKQFLFEENLKLKLEIEKLQNNKEKEENLVSEDLDYDYE